MFIKKSYLCFHFGALRSLIESNSLQYTPIVLVLKLWSAVQPQKNSTILVYMILNSKGDLWLWSTWV